MRLFIALVCLSSVGACAFEEGAISPATADGGTMDSAVGDGARDGTTVDSRRPDGSPADSSVVDSGPPDSTVMDSAVDTAIDTGCADRDGDGVCDADDVCPGGDDMADVDGDGTPDDCDDCPIDGPAATPIPTSVTNTGITISGVSLDGGGNVAIVDRGDPVSVSLDYTIVDCGCPGCIDQIEIGLIPGMSYQYCAYSAVPGCSGDSGSDTDTLRAPGGPGVYYVRFGRAQNFGCTHTNWWDGSPPPARTIGALCVR